VGRLLGAADILVRARVATLPWTSAERGRLITSHLGTKAPASYDRPIPIYDSFRRFDNEPREDVFYFRAHSSFVPPFVHRSRFAISAAASRPGEGLARSAFSVEN
jgi:hypothetical protein